MGHEILDLVPEMMENKIKKAVGFVLIYSKKEKVSEKTVLNPKSIYALSKMYCEKLFEIYATHLGINWKILRMFNIYGPGQDLNRMDQGMVSIFMNLVMKKDIINVKGSLERFRDFVYIDDVVAAWELCLLDEKNHNEIYNLGSGEKTSVQSLISSLKLLFEKDSISVNETKGTPGDINGCYANINKIKSQLGFIPKFNIEKGLLAMSDWAKSLNG